MTLHPEYITKNGKKEFVVLSYDEFCRLQEMVSDIEDILELREAKKLERDLPVVSLEEIKQIFTS